MKELITFITPKFPGLSLPQYMKKMMEVKNKARQTIIKNTCEKYGLDVSLPPRAGGYRVPYGFLTIASIVRNLGFDIQYLPQDYLEKKGEWNRRLNESIKTSDIFLFTTLTVDYPIMISLVHKIKRTNTNATCIVGGPHVTFMDMQALTDGVDIVVRGDGEETIQELMNNLRNYERLRNIDGITFKDKYGKIKRNKPRRSANINEAPVPAFDVLPADLRKYSRIYFFTSRGCPFRCEFCAERGTPLRFLSIDKVEEHLANVVNFFPFYNFLFLADSNFGIFKKRERKIAKALKKRFDGIYVECQTHPSLMPRSHLKYLAKHNFISVAFGIESFSDIILSRIQKGKCWNFRDYYNYLKKIKNDMPIRWSYLMIGHPGETYKTTIQTIRRCKNILKRVLLDFTSSKMFTPLPGTPIFSNPHNFGVKILTYNFTRYDRFDCPPPYQLNTLSQKEILVFFKILYALETYFACIRAEMTAETSYLEKNLKKIINEISNHNIKKLVKKLELIEGAQNWKFP